MNKFDIYITGVGGQGIGGLAEILTYAADNAGFKVTGVDTHGLAQRGGTVVSHVRIGEKAFSPIIMDHTADLVIATEKTEALRGLINYSSPNSTLIYLDNIIQPLNVRLGLEKDVTSHEISKICEKNGIIEICIENHNFSQSWMHNIHLLNIINKKNLIPGLNEKDYIESFYKIFKDSKLEKNIKIFKGEIL